MPVYRVRVIVQETYFVDIEADDSGDAYIAADMLTVEDARMSDDPHNVMVSDYDIDGQIGVSPDFLAEDLLERG